jgi:hypothetical protein
LETSAPDDKRELMVHLFYPADPNASGERAVYVPDADLMSGPWKPDQIERIQALRAYGLEGVPLPPGEAKYPVLIFSPGGGMKGLNYHVFCEDLASHGWIVAAIDPPYNAKAVRLPDGRVLGNLKPAERGWPQPKNQQDEIRNYVARIGHWARDISFVIDQLAALDKADGPFQGRLDLARGVGAVGHSRGGQAAGTVRLIEPRVSSGVNIDGTAGPQAVLPAKEGDESAGTQPFLWIQKRLFDPPTDEQLKRAGRTRAEFEAEVERVMGGWHRQLGTIPKGAIRLYIDRTGVDHIDFSDEHFWDGTLTDETRPDKLQTIAETRAWLRAFFRGTQLGDWTDLKQLAAETPKTQPEVSVHLFGQMWP